LEVIGLLRLHGAMTALIELAANRFRENFPDHMADQVFFPLSRQFEDAFVHVGVTPVAIDDGESIADAGQSAFALVEQITDGALVPTCSRGRSERSHQRDYSQRRWEDEHVGIPKDLKRTPAHLLSFAPSLC
jgi:hypothetical protein